MGKKNIKVGNNLNKHSEMSRTSAWADRGKKTSARLYPSFRHILIGLSVCQMVMVAVSAATLGAFVNSNVRMFGYFAPNISNRCEILKI